MPPESLFLDVKVIKKYSLCEGPGDDCSFVQTANKHTRKTRKQQQKNGEKGEKSHQQQQNLKKRKFLLFIESGMTYTV